MALLGQGFEDPRSAAVMALAGGLLRGDFGGGLLGANQAYGQAVDRQTLTQDRAFKQKLLEQEVADAAAKRGFLSGLPSPENASSTQQMMLQGVRAGAMPFGDYLKAIQPKELPFAKVDPKDYTPESVQAFAQAGGDYTKLQPVRKLDVVNNQAVDLYKANPGTVFDMQDPNKPFMLRGGQAVANEPFQKYSLDKARAGASRMSVTTKQEGEESKAVGKFFGENYADVQKAGFGAQSAINRLDRLGGLLEGVDTGKFAPLGVEVAKTAQSLGLNVDPNLANKEAAIALSSEIALQLRNPSGGAGLPGAMSDADRNFLAGMVPGIEKTPAGRKAILETARKLAKRDIDVARMARDYRQKRGTINEGFYEELARFSESNPLFQGGAAPASGSPSIDALLQKYGK